MTKNDWIQIAVQAAIVFVVVFGFTYGFSKYKMRELNERLDKIEQALK